MKPDNIKVLLVEDNPGDARLVREMLVEVSAGEYELTHVITLGDALDALKHACFDVMLLDLSLPDAHGLEAVNRVLNTVPTQAIVILSGIHNIPNFFWTIGWVKINITGAKRLINGISHANI